LHSPQEYVGGSIPYLYRSSIKRVTEHLREHDAFFFWALIFMIPLTLYGTFFGGTQTAVHFSAAANKARWLDWKNWMNLLFLGLIASAFAFAAWNKVCAYIGTVRATVGIYLIPVVTIIFAFFALGEKITLMGGIGALLTITGLFISEWKSKKIHSQN